MTEGIGDPMDDTLSGMDETTRTIIERITVRFDKPTVIRSGHSCKVYYDCIQLTPSDLARLAAQATGHLHRDEFDLVVGCAYHGILFASAIAGGKHAAILQADGKLCGPPVRGSRVVLVDDVVSTGKGLSKAQRRLEEEGANVVGFACIVDRSGGNPVLNKPLWSAYRTNME